MRKLFPLLVLFFAGNAYAQDHLASRFTRLAPTVTASSAYVSGYNVGGKLTFTGALCNTTGSGIVTSVAVRDLSENGSAYDLVLFSGNPSHTTFTDHATLDIDDADLNTIVAVISLATTDAVGFNDDGLSYKASIAVPVFVAPYTGILYGALVTRGTPTYAATTDINIQISTLCD